MKRCVNSTQDTARLLSKNQRADIRNMIQNQNNYNVSIQHYVLFNEPVKNRTKVEACNKKFLAISKNNNE
jgi:hypothetical protein